MCLGSVSTHHTTGTTTDGVAILDISETLRGGDFTAVDQAVEKTCYTQVWFSELCTEELYEAIGGKAGNKFPKENVVSCLNTINVHPAQLVSDAKMHCCLDRNSDNNS